jgi:hypothetical protein
VPKQNKYATGKQKKAGAATAQGDGKGKEMGVRRGARRG